MSHGQLNSDHVNYLILRYLQEAGHENAARALYTDWHRSDEYSDPETLPFAADVTQSQLIHIIQDGLFHDRLQASVTKEAPRFRLTDPRSPRLRPVPRVRRRSLHGHVGQGPVPDDPSSASSGRRAKKQGGRRNPALNIITNGDRNEMELDSAGPDDAASRSSSTPPHAHGRDALDNDDDDGGDRDADFDDTPPVEVASHGTQTIKRSRFRTRTTYLTLDRSQVHAAVMHAAWCPGQSAVRSPRLLVTGDSICRVYSFDADDRVTCATSELEASESINRHSFVTASTWHPSGGHYTCAVHGFSDATSHTPGPYQIIDCALDGGSHYLDIPPTVSRDHAIVLMVQYSPAGDSKFVISTNGIRTLLQIWKHPIEHDGEGRDTDSSCVVQAFPRVVMDAVWLNEREIAVCGDRTFSVVSLPTGRENEPTRIDVDPSLIGDDGTSPAVWDRIRYDRGHDVLICSCTVANKLRFYTRIQDPNVPAWRLIADAPAQLSQSGEMLTAMALERAPEGDRNGAPQKLAVAFQNGVISIFEMTRSDCRQTATLSLGDGTSALALAWSPSGTRLAVAGDEVFKIWDLSSPLITDPVWSWRFVSAKWSQGDSRFPGADGDDAANPSLDWEASGQKLALAVGKKVAIVSIIEEEGEPTPALEDNAAEI